MPTEKPEIGFLRDERGMEVVEYAIIVGLIVVAALVAITAIGIWVLSVYETLQSTVDA